MEITDPNDPGFVGELHEWTAQYNMELSDAVLASDSPAERAIYKLLDYVAHCMPTGGPLTEEARAKGLKPRQIRYFLRSYEPPEDKRAEYGFIDQIRFLFERVDAAYSLIGDKPVGWMSEQKMNKHLENLVRVKAIEKKDGRYRQVEGQYYNPGLPNYYKRMIKGIPAEWMVPHTSKVRTNLVYLNDRDRLISPGRKTKGRPSFSAIEANRLREKKLDAFEKALLAKCDEFGVQVRELYEEHMGKLDLKETNYVKGLQVFYKEIATGKPSNDLRKGEPDPDGTYHRSVITKADFNEWKGMIHDYWRLMPVLVIDPRPRPDEVP